MISESSKIPNYHELKAIRTKDMLSTSDINSAIGITMSRDFIAKQLEIYPKLETNLGYYWDKKDLQTIKLCLAKYLVDSILEGKNNEA